jgi:hypothetical protein
MQDILVIRTENSFGILKLITARKYLQLIYFIIRILHQFEVLLPPCCSEWEFTVFSDFFFS